MRLADLLNYAVIVSVTLLTACQVPFGKTGPSFDPRPATSVTLTNLNTIDVAQRPSATARQVPEEPFTVGPGDKLEIEILADPTTRTMTTVGPDGKIYFYLLPGTDVWGLTLAQVREKLRQELAKYLAAPEVSVNLRAIESKRVWLLGQIRNAGVYPIGAPTTLLEAIASAGGLLNATGPGTAGLTDPADLRRSFVIRQGQIVPVDFYRLIKEGDMDQNIYLQADDFVYVPAAMANDVYVLGAVRVAQPILWSDSVTLVSSIARAGGTVKDAYLSQVAIVRGSLSEPKIAIVNYREIVSGKAADVRLQPRDIVYVPFSPYKGVVKYLNLVLDTFARAIAINEGARAVSRDVSPVGVQIGIGVR